MYNKLESHPIKKLLDKGVKVTINTDNRTVSNITLEETYKELKETFHFSKEDFINMNKRAIECAFISEKEKQELLNLLIK